MTFSEGVIHSGGHCEAVLEEAIVPRYVQRWNDRGHHLPFMDSPALVKWHLGIFLDNWW
jgi:hypothetical protein